MQLLEINAQPLWEKLPKEVTMYFFMYFLSTYSVPGPAQDAEDFCN